MTNKPTPDDELREQLAAIEHERWADWQAFLHSKLTRHNGVKGQCKPGMLMSPSLYEHWEYQIASDYSELTDQEKASDMEQVDRYWPIVEAAINAKITELLVEELERLPIFYEYVESGGDRIDSQATIYIRERIKQLQASQPINVAEEK